MKYEVTFTRNMLQEATVIVDLPDETTIDDKKTRSLAEKIAYKQAVFEDIKELDGNTDIRLLG